MSLINRHRRYCYRITHIHNLPLILQNGIVTKNHINASENYTLIGDQEIIDYRETASVRINGYGKIGDYVPFYFTPKTPMLYSIITGYKSPKVPKRNRRDILVIRCDIKKLCECKQWFFTDAQGNSAIADHHNDLTYLSSIDWDIINNSDFKKTNEYLDKTRRYQAEFLVYNYVAVHHIESLNVYDQDAATFAKNELDKNNINLALKIKPKYFFK